MKSEKVEKFYLSPFALKININSGTLLFNTLNESLIELDNSGIAILETILDDSRECKDSTILHNLLRCGFLSLNPNLDYSLFNLKLNKGRFSAIDSTIVIIPTLQCNYNCSYCYRGGSKSGHMSHKDVLHLKKYVQNKYQNSRNVHVIWHGGEPLLAWDIIFDLSVAFKCWAKSKNIKYSAKLLTNGSILNKDIISQFEKLNINRIQISFDGPKSLYNQEHKSKTLNKSIFERVVKNIIDVMTISPNTNIVIKYNVNRNNHQMVHEFLNDVIILKNNETVSLNFGHATNYTCECNMESCEFLNNVEFAEWYWHIVPEIRRLGWPIPTSLPSGDRTVCEADHFNSVCIASNGNLFRCDAEATEEKGEIGHVAENNESYIEHSKLNHLCDYLDYNPLNDTLCGKCNIIPLCLGGCPYMRIRNKRDAMFCQGVKRFVELQIIDYWKHLKMKGEIL